MKKDKFFLVGIKALIENREGKILLLQAGPNRNPLVKNPYWDLPGGRIQDRQSVKEVLSREIKEETGIEKASESEFFTAAISNHELLYEGSRVGLVLLVYKVWIPKNSSISLSKEHTAYEWVNSDEAAKRLAHKYPPEFTELLT